MLTPGWFRQSMSPFPAPPGSAFIRNILAYVPQKEKKAFAAVLKEIWLAPTAELARKRAYDVIDSYAKRFPKAVQYIEDKLKD